MGVTDVGTAVDGLPRSVSETCGYGYAVPALGYAGSAAARFGAVCDGIHTGAPVCALGRADRPRGGRPFAALVEQAVGLTPTCVVGSA